MELDVTSSSASSSVFHRRRHKFRHTLRATTLPSYYDTKVLFFLICYIQLFLMVVSAVILLNMVRFQTKNFVVSIVRSVIVAVGIFGASYASSAWLLLFEVAQVLCFAFELQLLLNSLTMEAQEVCRLEHDSREIILKEKLYSFAVIAAACVVAERLRRCFREGGEHPELSVELPPSTTSLPPPVNKQPTTQETNDVAALPAE